MLILAIPENLNKLLEYGGLAAITSLSELGRVMIVAVDFSFVFVVAVLSAKYCRAQRASEMVDMILPVKSCDIGPAKGTATLMAEKIEAAKVISLAKWILTCSIVVVGRKEP